MRVHRISSTITSFIAFASFVPVPKWICFSPGVDCSLEFFRLLRFFDCRRKQWLTLPLVTPNVRLAGRSSFSGERSLVGCSLFLRLFTSNRPSRTRSCTICGPDPFSVRFGHLGNGHIQKPHESCAVLSKNSGQRPEQRTCQESDRKETETWNKSHVRDESERSIQKLKMILLILRLHKDDARGRHNVDDNAQWKPFSFFFGTAPTGFLTNLAAFHRLAIVRH